MRRSDFVKEVYSKLSIRPTPTNVAFGVAWASYEDTQAKNNIWATTEPWKDATEFNSVGVKNYATWENGVNATVATLKNGYYAKILFALRYDEDILDLLEGLTNSPWGSHPDIELYKSVKAHWGHYDVEVPGSNVHGDAPVAPVIKENSMTFEEILARLQALEKKVFGATTEVPVVPASVVAPAETIADRLAVAEATASTVAPVEVETPPEDASEPVEETPVAATTAPETIEDRIAAAQKELGDLKAQQ